MNYTIAVLMQVISVAIMVFLRIKLKELRKQGISTYSTLAVYCGALPLWLAAFLLSFSVHGAIWTQEYLLVSSVWIILNVVNNLLGLYIIRYFALSELKIYGLFLSVAIGVCIDILLFKHAFSATQIASIFILLISTKVFFSEQRSRRDRDISNTTKLLGVLLLTVIIASIQVTLYKLGVSLQTYPVVHISYAAFVSFSIVLAIGYTKLREDIRTRKVRYADIAIMSVLIFIFTILEAFIYFTLPIAIIITLSALSLVALFIYDIEKKELHINTRTILGLGLTMIAMVLIAI